MEGRLQTKVAGTGDLWETPEGGRLGRRLKDRRLKFWFRAGTEICITTDTPAQRSKATPTLGSILLIVFGRIDWAFSNIT